MDWAGPAQLWMEEQSLLGCRCVCREVVILRRNGVPSVNSGMAQTQ